MRIFIDEAMTNLTFQYNASEAIVQAAAFERTAFAYANNQVTGARSPAPYSTM